MSDWTFRKVVSACLEKWRQYARYRWRVSSRAKSVVLFGIKVRIAHEFPKRIAQVMYQGKYESVEAQCIVAKLSSDDIVLEIGAGIGFISTLCAKKIGSKQVFACEADPGMIPKIRETYQINDVNPTLIHAAVTRDQVDLVEFQVNQEFWSSSLYSRQKLDKLLKVPNRYVNDLIDEISPTFLVVDIEGYEKTLLPEVELSKVSKILIEIHSQLIGLEETRRLRAYLTDQGFAVDSEVSIKNVMFLERLGKTLC